MIFSIKKSFLFGFIFISTSVIAQNSSVSDSVPFYEMSLEQLMKVNVTVASHTPMSARESPGILTVLTDDEIRKSGAKDLIEVLKTIPGFDFGVDVEGIVGIAIRGNWGHEGKVLMLWDGFEVNEELYSTLQFGAHYPVCQIKRIEIIRGPGSAIYGGNAEYAVINITTNNNKDLNGVNAEVVYSQMSKTFAQRSVYLNAGKNFGAVHLNYSSSLSQANRSQSVYTDRDGNSYDMKNQSAITTIQQRADLFYKNFSLSGLLDSYSVDQRDGYDNIHQRPFKNDFKTIYLLSKYEYKAGKILIVPGVKYKFNKPWSVNESSSEDNIGTYNTYVNRTEIYVNSSYDQGDWLQVVGGINYYNQQARQPANDLLYFSNGTKCFYFDNYAAFLQGIVKYKKVNFILGARYNDNSRYNHSFVPRLGVTSVFDKWHIKALYSKAFRSPSIENINVEPAINPENTIVSEVELGYKLTDRSYLTANVFDIVTQNTIVYFYDSLNNDKYKNDQPTGTRGLEVEYKWKYNRWLSNLNYSFFIPAVNSVISTYSVPDHPTRVLAFPQHRINWQMQLPLSENICFAYSISGTSDRYSSVTNSQGDVVTTKYPAVIYSGLNLSYSDLFHTGLELQLGCFNLTNQKTYFIQPYKGDHNPLLGSTREFQIKIRYSINSKN